ncbi:MAG TPA: hypothetical protein PKL30_26395 [Leptospiraceae bacterium]|nr:hypothetical protein [Leptospiraceae bacterium]
MKNKEKELSENFNDKNKGITRVEREIRALKNELDLLESLQLTINSRNLNEKKESDNKIIKKYLIEINYLAYREREENSSDSYLFTEIDKLKLKKKMIHLEEKKKTIEKNITALENQIIELERQPLSQGEIVSISFQFLYKLAFILTIELISFFLLKQYRLSLDEARYFNNLLKENERNLVLIEILNYEKDKKLREKVYNDIILQSSNSKLLAGESTEFLESKKLSKDDENLISKSLEVLNKLFQK